MEPHEICRIRRARTTDAEALQALTQQLGYPSSLEAISARSDALGARDDHALLVAAVAEGIRGWIHVFMAHRLEADAFAEIGGLVTDATARGRGVGTALVEAAENWARSRGATTIRVRSNVLRSDAHRFYLRRGYASLKQQAVFQRSLEPSE